MPWDSSRAKEYRLLRLLETQFPWMAKSYAEGISSIAAAAGDATAPNNPRLHWCKDADGRRFFRLDLDLPALFMLSEPVSRFKAYRQYVVPIAEETKYYADLALIPAYFGNFNRMTCIDLYGDQAAAIFAAGSRPLQGEQKIFWRFEPSAPSPAQLSSLNFVLKWSSQEKELPDSISSALALYFQYSFWVVPKRGFACGAHIIHSRDNISRIMKVAKGLYIVRRIGEVHPERIAPYHTSLVQKVEMDVVSGSGEVRPISTYMAKDVVERLTSQGPSNTDIIINGAIFEFKDKVDRPGGGLTLCSRLSRSSSPPISIFSGRSPGCPPPNSSRRTARPSAKSGPASFGEMHDLGINTVRMGEFAWAIFEPSPGKFEFDWMDRALDIARRYGISAVIGTPTASVPPWLYQQFPDVLSGNVQGPFTYGGRKGYNTNSLHYLDACARIVTALADHYGKNPTVIGWQLDNEPGNPSAKLRSSLGKCVSGMAEKALRHARRVEPRMEWRVLEQPVQRLVADPFSV